VIEGEADELIVRTPASPASAWPTAASCLPRRCRHHGTFLRGLIHLGEKNWPAGRVDEAPAMGLSKAFERAALCSDD